VDIAIDDTPGVQIGDALVGPFDRIENHEYRLDVLCCEMPQLAPDTVVSRSQRWIRPEIV
jgi:hypothetical protein